MSNPAYMPITSDVFIFYTIRLETKITFPFAKCICYQKIYNVWYSKFGRTKCPIFHRHFIKKRTWIQNEHLHIFFKFHCRRTICLGVWRHFVLSIQVETHPIWNPTKNEEGAGNRHVQDPNVPGRPEAKQLFRHDKNTLCGHRLLFTKINQTKYMALYSILQKKWVNNKTPKKSLKTL